ncbi:MAG: glycosyltransferase family 87 protein [Bauldia sp.]
MASFWQHIRSGDWLTAERRRVYPLIVLALAVIVSLFWVATSDRLIDRVGSPIGTDFSNVYAAGTQVRAGELAAVYDPARQHQAEIALFDGRFVPFYGWHYPPMFLFVAAVLALLPYGWALLVYMAVTFAAYLATLRAILPRPQTLLVAAAFPAVFVNLGHGQNGFLTAALIGGALLLLDRRPAVAGILIGLLAYKPQFGVLIPLVLIASARWRTFAAATATVIVECGLALTVFGREVWVAFAGSAHFTRTVVLEEGQTGWHKIQSLFSAVRIWGGTLDLAYGAQLGLGVGLAATLVWLWRSDARFDLKAAALVTASLLATPYMLDYDLVALAVAGAFFVRHGLANGFRDFEITALAFAWLAPLVARTVAGATGVPLGLLAMLLLYALTLRRAAADLAEAQGRERLVEA